ncbi:MAG: ABC transporter ATP-binding protein [Firmicutes bacterium]|nr:ABC transporter ATP-binding protein [Bacillota bacterium]
MISIHDLHASYEGDEILHGIDAAFPEGKISVLMGPNGCGKSTTLRSLVRLVPQRSGRIEIDGQSADTYTPRDLARKIAYLPQSRNVPDIAVRSLVMHGRFPYLSYPRRYRPEDHRKVQEALEWVGLSDLADRKMENLSGGQRQKAYLAMALAQDTDVILMDEPTTFLDIRNQFDLLDRAKQLARQGKTVIMILHDFEAILRYADHVILLHDGSVLQEGRAEDVLRSTSIPEAFRVTPVFYQGDDGLHCYVHK